MKKLGVVIISLICLSAFMDICLRGENERLTVTAVGEAEGTGFGAKERSRENALRNAVEKGFGVYIDSATLIENAQLISDYFIAETRGFVRYYEILEQREQNGIFTTRIRAEVALEKIWQSEPLNLLLKRMGAPRFIIIATEDHEGVPVARSCALQQVTELLVTKGFTLVNTADISNLTMIQIKAALSNARAAAEIGRRTNAEIIVMVNASGSFDSYRESYGVRFKLYNSHCDIKAVQLDSGKIIAAATKTRKGGSIKKAIASAAKDNANEFVKQLLSSWSKKLNMGRGIVVVISNVSSSQLGKIVEKMRTLNGVNDIQQRTFSNRRAQLEIKSRYKAPHLADSIEKLQGFKLEITSLSADRMEIILK